MPGLSLSKLAHCVLDVGTTRIWSTRVSGTCLLVDRRDVVELEVWLFPRLSLYPQLSTRMFDVRVSRLMRGFRGDGRLSWEPWFLTFSGFVRPLILKVVLRGNLISRVLLQRVNESFCCFVSGLD